jgi:Domain found in Dishevelled, Egl-10, and Pleckstrin (DEP)
MPKHNPNQTSVVLAMPHDAAYRSARALVMAYSLIPEPLTDSPSALTQLGQRLGQREQDLALLDLGSLPLADQHVVDWHRRLPEAARARIMLTRHEQGPVWASDQLWVKQMGFAGLFAECDATAMLVEQAALPQTLAQLAQQPALSTPQLAQYFAALQAKPDPLTLRGLIRSVAGRDAESLAQALASGVRAADRSYRFKTYAACFVAKDAVRWLTQHLKCSSKIAIQIGLALQKLGLLHHVVHEHEFQDAELFFRVDATQLASQAHLGMLLKALRDEAGLAAKDRTHLGKTYPQCWVGSEAVDWLHQHWRLPRYECENLLNRLHSYGLVRHVLSEHRVKDGYYFYQFV